MDSGLLSIVWGSWAGSGDMQYIAAQLYRTLAGR